MRAWDSKILDKKRQLPEPGSVEEKALGQLMQLGGIPFEKLVTSLIDTVGGNLVRDLENKKIEKMGVSIFFRSIYPS